MAFDLRGEIGLGVAGAPRLALAPDGRFAHLGLCRGRGLRWPRVAVTTDRSLATASGLGALFPVLVSDLALAVATRGRLANRVLILATCRRDMALPPLQRLHSRAALLENLGGSLGFGDV